MIELFKGVIMSKNKFEVVDYEDAVRLYGDIEFTFYDYWKHSFR